MSEYITYTPYIPRKLKKYNINKEVWNGIKVDFNDELILREESFVETAICQRCIRIL